MKKRFSRKAPPKKKVVYGAYDILGQWWDKQDIENYPSGMIEHRFKKYREDIEIITREIS